jgi:glycosyltransferase involved in cell wall biosynthesis
MNISVVIPTYNRIELLKRSIDSVINQTIKPSEIIIVDDGSNDGTEAMVKKKYDSLKLIKQKNKGASAARNTGIKASSGEWICFLDSDDEWKNDKLEKQIIAVANNSDYKFFHSNEIWIKNGKRINQKKKHKKYGGDIFKKCLDMCRISPSSVLIDKSIFEEIGFFNENLVVCEDYELWLRICDKYEVFFIDEPLIFKYGGHQGQLSYSIDSIEYHRIKALEYLLSTGLSKENRDYTIQMLISKISIYLNGLIKRGKKHEIAVYEEKIKVWNKFSIEY